MRVCFTPAARRQLLDAVVELRDRDRDAAWGLVDGVHRRLETLEDDNGGEAADVDRAIALGDDRHRLYTRVRGEVLWVLAVWPAG